MRASRLILVVPLTVLLGCQGSHTPARTLTLATTTSTQDSGLLEVLVPMFREQAGIEVRVVAVGSGQALQLGRRGDADVILAHSPEAEDRFMAEGHGEGRRAVMHNDFVLVGPRSDPAGVRGETSVVRAMSAIAGGRSAFVSRGDDSGIHQKEKQMWKEAGIEPVGAWYVEAGAGMAQVLRTADQKRAYTVSDRATYLAEKGRLDLAVMVQGDPMLENRYQVIVVSPAKHPGVRSEAARRFAELLTSEGGRKAISGFGIERYGEPLFVPD